MTNVSQFNVIHDIINVFISFDVGTPWDVLVLKAAVFSTDMAQIIAAQPLLQGYFDLTFSIYLGRFLGLRTHITKVFMQCHIFIVSALHFSERFTSATINIL